ncbi:hypothetical protein K438DRAFT_1773472 [Mycena galopus ATCC 62051]|nr:hypothetical protein K438DRAFT_1773472 [Mycena galopus ATCC 62051]
MHFISTVVAVLSLALTSPSRIDHGPRPRRFSLLLLWAWRSMLLCGIDWTAHVPIGDHLPRQYYSVHQHLLPRALLKAGIFDEIWNGDWKEGRKLQHINFEPAINLRSNFAITVTNGITVLQRVTAGYFGVESRGG